MHGMCINIYGPNSPIKRQKLSDWITVCYFLVKINIHWLNDPVIPILNIYEKWKQISTKIQDVHTSFTDNGPKWEMAYRCSSTGE